MSPIFSTLICFMYGFINFMAVHSVKFTFASFGSLFHRLSGILWRMECHNWYDNIDFVQDIGFVSFPFPPLSFSNAIFIFVEFTCFLMFLHSLHIRFQRIQLHWSRVISFLHNQRFVFSWDFCCDFQLPYEFNETNN